MCETAAKKYNRIILLKNSKIHTDDCSICLESLAMKTINSLPCGHSFHHVCLYQAFEKKLYTCPLCRYDLVEALLNSGFKFPMFYDAYASDAYYSIPELIQSDSEDDYTPIWNDILLNLLRDNFAYIDIDAPAGAAPLADAAAAEPEMLFHEFLILYNL
jgi:hypothetical protein